MRKIVLLPLLVTLIACDAGPEEVPAEVAAARFEARRRACVAAELLRRAEDDVTSLEQTLAETGEGPTAEITRRASTAALAFARAYEQHAQLRTAGFARVDSAMNYSERAADSARHMEAADRVTLRPPEPGTIERNVLEAWERDFAELYRDADHPCNWE